LTCFEQTIINICSHDEIALPGLKKKLDDNGEEVEGMNIPMSVGPLRKGKDKSDKECYICDIIVNPAVIEEAKADKVGKYRDFVCQLSIQCLEQKYSKTYDRKYKLPKLLYMGETVLSQHIQDRKSIPKIEEVAATSASSSDKNSNESLHNKGAKKTQGSQSRSVEQVPDQEPEFSMFIVEVDGEGELRERLAHEFDIQNNGYVLPTLLPTSQDRSCSVRRLDVVVTLPVLSAANAKDISVQVNPYKAQVRLHQNSTSG